MCVYMYVCDAGQFTHYTTLVYVGKRAHTHNTNLISSIFILQLLDVLASFGEKGAHLLGRETAPCYRRQCELLEA